jgi:hypothetical protein
MVTPEEIQVNDQFHSRAQAPAAERNLAERNGFINVLPVAPDQLWPYVR